MTEILESIDNNKATFRDFLSYPAFADEISFFASGGETSDIFGFLDAEDFLDQVLTFNDWENDRISLEMLVQYFEFYAAYFRDLFDFSPDEPPSRDQAESYAVKLSELLTKKLSRRNVRSITAELRAMKEALDNQNSL